MAIARIKSLVTRSAHWLAGLECSRHTITTAKIKQLLIEQSRARETYPIVGRIESLLRWRQRRILFPLTVLIAVGLMVLLLLLLAAGRIVVEIVVAVVIVLLQPEVLLLLLLLLAARSCLAIAVVGPRLPHWRRRRRHWSEGSAHRRRVGRRCVLPTSRDVGERLLLLRLTSSSSKSSGTFALQLLDARCCCQIHIVVCVTLVARCCNLILCGNCFA